MSADRSAEQQPSPPTSVLFGTNTSTMRRSLLVLPALFATAVNAQIVINEVDYDQVSTDNAEFIEIKNIGETAFPMQYVAVVMYNGSSGAADEYRNISSESWPPLEPGDYFVVCANMGLTLNCDHAATPITNLIQNGANDAIVLVSTIDSQILDVVSYGGSLPGYVEGTGTTAEDTNLSDGVSIGRSPDGNDTNDNDADFFLMCSTPGAENLIDPAECDLSTGVQAPVNAGSSFTILPLVGGEQAIVHVREAAATSMRLEVFAADGKLLKAESLGTATTAQWTIDARELHGSMFLVRYSTPEKQVTRRIVLQ